MAVVGWVPMPCHFEIDESSMVVGRDAAEPDFSMDLDSFVGIRGSHSGGGPLEAYVVDSIVN